MSFTAFYGANLRGLFTATTASDVTEIANSSGDFNFFGSHSISDGGALVFQATSDSGASGIYLKGTGSVTPLIDSAGPYGLFGGPAINAAGSVAVNATLDAGGEELVLVNPGGTLSTVADTTGAFFSFYPEVDVTNINNPGAIMFNAVRDDGRNGVYLHNGATVVPVVESGVEFDSVGAGDVNDDGVIPVNTVLAGGGERALWLWNDGVLTPIADSTGEFDHFGSPAINSKGGLAFTAFLDTGGYGVFTGGDPIGDRVLVPGQSLFGSTVLDAYTWHGLDDFGRIAIQYTLASGREGIILATPVPEPRAAVLSVLAIALAHMHGYRSRRTNLQR